MAKLIEPSSMESKWVRNVYTCVTGESQAGKLTVATRFGTKFKPYMPWGPFDQSGTVFSANRDIQFNIFVVRHALEVHNLPLGVNRPPGGVVAPDACVVHVVDSTAKKLGADRCFLHRNLSEDKVVGVPLLVFANKQDKPGARSPKQVAEELELSKFRTHPWIVLPSCGVTGAGIAEGFAWLQRVLNEQASS